MSAVGPCATFASAQNPLPQQGDYKHDNANHDSNGPCSITLLRHIFPLRARWLIERHRSKLVLRPADEGVRPT